MLYREEARGENSKQKRCRKNYVLWVIKVEAWRGKVRGRWNVVVGEREEGKEVQIGRYGGRKIM